MSSIRPQSSISKAEYDSIKQVVAWLPYQRTSVRQYTWVDDPERQELAHLGEKFSKILSPPLPRPSVARQPRHAAARPLPRCHGNAAAPARGLCAPAAGGTAQRARPLHLLGRGNFSNLHFPTAPPGLLPRAANPRLLSTLFPKKCSTGTGFQPPAAWWSLLQTWGRGDNRQIKPTYLPQHSSTSAGGIPGGIWPSRVALKVWRKSRRGSGQTSSRASAAPGAPARSSFAPQRAGT